MNDRFGLSEEDIRSIQSALSSIVGLERAVVFGSRAKGNFRPGSDVDIALYGQVDANEVRRAGTYLNEETAMPYHFDLIDYSSISLPVLKDHIDRVGKLLFPDLHH